MHSTHAIVIVLSFGYIHEANMLQPITLTLTLFFEWLECWTQSQKGPGSNRSRDAVWQQS